MAKARRTNQVKLLGVVRRKRSALMVSTALQATVLLVLSQPADAQPAPNARPTGGSVVAGGAAISTTASNTRIDQSTQRAAIDWKTFNVGSQQSVTFQQPSATSVTLNRVTGPDPSRIAGRIDANGQVILTNQSGVTFYQGAQVNTNGLMVSAIGASDKSVAAFMAGSAKLALDQPGNPNAVVDNRGNITVREAGLAALVAPQVANSGTITAQLGHVILAGAKTATLDLYGDGLLALDVTNQVAQTPVDKNGNSVTALVTNSGVVIADGGTVQLTARAADGIVQTLVQAGGKIQAATMGDHTGVVALNGVGGSIVVEGQLSAPGIAPGTKGGAIEIATTGNVVLTSAARVDASGRAGGGTVAIGTDLARAKGPSVTPTVVAANVVVQKGAKVTANATGKGDGGHVVVLSGTTTHMDGLITAKGGAFGGDGGFVEVSGVNLGITGSIDVSAPSGALGNILLDPDFLDIVVGNTTPGAGTENKNFKINSGTVFAGDGLTGTPDTVSNGIIDAFAGNVLLQANKTITVAAPISLTTNPGQNLTLEAGGTITVNTGIVVTASGDIILATGGAGPNSPPAAQAAPLISLLGTLNSTGGSVSLLAGKTGTVSIGAAGLISAPTAGKLITLQQDTLTVAAGGKATATTGTIEIAPATASAITLGGAGGLSLPQATLNAMSASTLRLGAATIAGVLTPTANAISVAGAINLTGIATTLDLQSTGAVSQTAASILTLGTLTGSVTAVKLDQANAIGNIGSFAATAGDFLLVDGGVAATLGVSGPLTATNVTISGAPTLAVSGSIGATGTAALTAATIDVGNGAIVTGPTVSLNAGAGGIALTGNAAVGQAAGTVDLSSAGTISEAAASVITAGTLQSSGGVSGDVTLPGTANAIVNLGNFSVANANFSLFDKVGLTVIGNASVTGAAKQLSLEAPSISIIAAAGVAADAASGLLSLQTNSFANSGAVKAATVELAPVTTGGSMTLGAAGGLSLLSLSGFTTGNLIVGAVTPPGGARGTTAGSIAIGGTFDTTGVSIVSLDASGAVTQSAPLIGGSQLFGSAGSYKLLDGKNDFSALGVSTTGGDIQIADSTAVSLSANSTAGNIYLSSPSTKLTGAVSAGGVLGLQTDAFTFVAGSLTGSTIELAPLTSIAETLGASGGLSLTSTAFLNTSTLHIGSITIPVVGLKTTAASISVGGNFGSNTIALELDTNGAVTEAAAAVLTASTLTGNAVTGFTLDQANAINTLGSVNVSGGSFTLADGGIAGALGVTGPVTASAVTITGAPTITVGGSIGATGTVALASGAGGIALGKSAVVTGTTLTLNGAAGGIALSNDARLGDGTAVLVDLTTTGASGVSETGTSFVTAATLQSAGGIGTAGLDLSTGANNIQNIASVASGGLFNLNDSGVSGTLGVAGPLTATTVNITGAPAIAVAGSIGATGTLALTTGKLGFNNGATVTGTTLNLAAGGGGISLTGNASVGQAGAVINLTSTGTVSETGTSILTADTLQAPGGLGSVSLPNANNIGTLGAVSAPDIALNNSTGLIVAAPVTATGGAVNLTTASGDLTNGSTISSTTTTAAGPGQDYISNGGRFAGPIVNLHPARDIIMNGGVVAATGATPAKLNAGRDIIENSGLISAANDGTLIAGRDITQVTGSISFGNNGTLNAGQDFLQSGGVITAGGAILTVSAARHVTQTAGLITATTGGATLSLLAGQPTPPGPTGTLAIGGTVSASNVVLVAPQDITETGTLIATTLTGTAGAAPTSKIPDGLLASANFTGATPTVNQIGTLGNFLTTGSLVLNDGIALNVAGTVTTGAVASTNAGVTAASLFGAAINVPNSTLTVSGLLTAGVVAAGAPGGTQVPGGDVGLTAGGAILIPGAVTAARGANAAAGGGTLTMTAGFNINETGVIIADTLTGSSGNKAAGTDDGFASFAGASTISNRILNLAAFTTNVTKAGKSGDFLLTNGSDLTVLGSVVANSGNATINTHAGTNAVGTLTPGNLTLTNAGVITATDTVTPPGVPALTGNITLAADKSITLNGPVTAAAGSSVSLTTDAAVASGTGTLTVDNTGGNLGSVTASAFIPAGATVAVQPGAIKITTDNLVLNAAAATTVLNAPDGLVAIAPRKAGNTISLGGVSSSGTLGISQSLLNAINTLGSAGGTTGSATLMLGSLDGTTPVAGLIDINAGIALGGIARNLVLDSSGAVQESGAGSLSVTSLAGIAQASTVGFSLTGANTIGEIGNVGTRTIGATTFTAPSTSGLLNLRSDGDVRIRDSSGTIIVVGTVAANAGTLFPSGTIALTAPVIDIVGGSTTLPTGTIFGSGSLIATEGAHGAGTITPGLIALQADAMALATGGITASDGVVAIAPLTAGSTFSLDAATAPGHLSLTQADLSAIHTIGTLGAGLRGVQTLVLGSLDGVTDATNPTTSATTTSALQINTGIDLSSVASTVALFSAGSGANAISEVGGGIKVGALTAATSVGGINLGGTNSIGLVGNLGTVGGVASASKAIVGVTAVADVVFTDEVSANVTAAVVSNTGSVVITDTHTTGAPSSLTNNSTIQGQTGVTLVADVNITNNGTVNAVTNDASLTATTGDITNNATVAAARDAVLKATLGNINNNVLITAGRNAVLSAGADIDNNISATVTAGNFAILTAGGSINDAASGLITAAGAGSVVTPSVTLQATGGNIVEAATGTISATDAAGVVVLTAIAPGSNINTAGTVSASGASGLVSETAGSITQSGGTIIAGGPGTVGTPSVAITANTGTIGQTAGSILATNASGLIALTSKASDIATAGSIGATGTAAVINLTAKGSINQTAGMIAAGTPGDTTTAGVPNVTLLAQGGTIAQSADASVFANNNAGTVTLNASSNITFGGSIAAGGTAGVVSLLSGGSITETPATGILQAATLTGAAADGVSLTGSSATGNLIANLNTFTTGTVAAGDFVLLDETSLTVIGPVVSNTGSVVITDTHIAGPASSLTNNSTIQGQTGVTLVADVNVINNGTVNAVTNDTSVTATTGDITNNATISAARNAVLRATIGNINNNLLISAGNDAVLNAGANINNNPGAVITAGHDALLSAGIDIDNKASATITAGHFANLNAVGSINDAAGGLITAAGVGSTVAPSVTLVAQTGTISELATGTISATDAAGVVALTANAAGSNIDTAGIVSASGASGLVSETAGSITQSGGTIVAGGPGTVGTPSVAITANTGTIGQTAGSILATNASGLIALTSKASDIATASSIGATGTAGVINLTAKGSINQTAGTIASGTPGDTTTAGTPTVTLLTQTGTIAQSAGASIFATNNAGTVTLNSAGNITFGGSIAAAGTGGVVALLSLGTITETPASGILVAATLTGGAADGVTLTGTSATGNLITNLNTFTTGTVGAGDFVLLDEQSLTVIGPVVANTGSVVITDTHIAGPPSSLTNNSTIQGQTGVTLVADANITNAGTVNAVTNDASLTATTGDITNNVTVSAAHDAVLTATAGNITNNLLVSAGNDAKLTAAANINNNAMITAGHDAVLNAGADIDNNIGATVTAGHFGILNAGGSINDAAAGLITAAGAGSAVTPSVTLQATGGNIVEAATGTISATNASGVVALAANAPGSNINTAGTVAASGTSGLVSETAGSITQSGGTIIAGGPGTVGTPSVAITANTGTIGQTAGSILATNASGLIALTSKASDIATAGSIGATGTAGVANLTAKGSINQTAGTIAAGTPGDTTATGVPNVTLLAQGGTIAQSAGASVFANNNAGTVVLNSAGNIAFGGSIAAAGTAGVVALLSGGAITETAGSGILQAATLTGAAANGVSLTGTSATGNLIANLNTFTTGTVGAGDFVLLDEKSLAVIGPVVSNTGSVVITDTNIGAGGPASLTNGSTIQGQTGVTLVADANISNSGTVKAVTNDASLTATTGTITNTGSVGAAHDAVLTATLGTINNNLLASAGNDAKLTAGGSINNNPSAVITAGRDALLGAGVDINNNTSAAITAGRFTSLAAGGSINDAAGGLVSAAGAGSSAAPSVTLVAQTGTIGEAGGGSITATNATGVVSLKANASGSAISTAGTVSAPGASGLVSETAGSIIQSGGTILAGGPGTAGTPSVALTATSATIGQTAGSIVATNAAGSVSLSAKTGISVAGTVLAPNGAGSSSKIALATNSGTIGDSGVIQGFAVSLNDGSGPIAVTGQLTGSGSVDLVAPSVSETGILTAGTLTGTVGGTASLTGGTPTANKVSTVGSFSAANFILNDAMDVTIVGPLSAPKVIVDAGSNQITLASGGTIATGGTPRPVGTVATFPTSSNPVGAFLTAGSFTQLGSSTIQGLPAATDPSILRITVSQGSGNITFAAPPGLQAGNTWLILDVGAGAVSGNVIVKSLDIIRGPSGNTTLTGSVNGLSGPAAAGAADIQPSPSSNFRFNSCPIHSVNCVLLPTQGIPTANPLNDISFGSVFNPDDQDDLLLPIVSDQDY